MNKLITVLIITAFVVSQGYGQDVPPEVKAGFQKKFPTAANVFWENENGEFEAEFTLKGKAMSASFDKSGKWLQSESEIPESALPENVRTAIAEGYSDYRILESEKIEMANGEQRYEVKLDNDETIVEITFDSKGSMISRNALDDEDEDDDDDD